LERYLHARFLLRRVALNFREGLANVVVLGQQHSSNTLRLRGIPYRNPIAAMAYVESSIADPKRRHRNFDPSST